VKEQLTLLQNSANDSKIAAAASEQEELQALTQKLAAMEASHTKLKEQLVNDVASEKSSWANQVKDLEEKCRRLVEVGGSSGSGGGGGVDESTVVKKVKSAVNGVAGDVYTNAKGIFNSGESYDGKFVLKQIKNLLKQATKANSK
jgi:hypothetical protein